MSTLLVRRLLLAATSLTLVAGAAVSSGCQTSYAADIRNTTPQPVYAQLMEQFDTGSTLRASTRLGPGDRAGLGPVIARDGRAYLVIDTQPNPGTAVTVPLAPGTTTIEVQQSGNETTGPISVKIVGGNPPPAADLGAPPQPGK